MTQGTIMRAAHFPGRAPIDAYGNGGFRFADMSHIGSVLCLPSGVYGWEPSEILQLQDFKKLIDEAEQFDVLLVGMGEDLRPIPKALREALKDRRVVTEPMSTGAAVRTYNVLLAEDRRVAAALLAVS